ncbi:MAG: pro-sigmaK processing inhibitor BofA family protein [Bacilli bacterium]|nr:pro-sigmaK processing inhibitor BofA family protein [Bacilli bacterium]
MINKIIDVVKRAVISGFLLYGYNLIAVNFNMIIPINIFTVLGVTFLGAPAIVALILFKVLML